MKIEQRPKLIAIAGGSGAGKTWLANKLQLAFGDDAARLSLDDFYRDRSDIEPAERERINYDEPDAIDWALFEFTLRECRAANPVHVPRYDFATHTRRPDWQVLLPATVVFVDGLWLFQHPAIRDLFDLRIFLDCPEHLRWQRRLTRDVAERGRNANSIRDQFWTRVVPMHSRHVAPQSLLAHVVLEGPVRQEEIDELIAAICGRWSERSHFVQPPANDFLNRNQTSLCQVR